MGRVEAEAEEEHFGFLEVFESIPPLLLPTEIRNCEGPLSS